VGNKSDLGNAGLEACPSAIPGGIFSMARECPQECGHGRPEAHSTEFSRRRSPRKADG